jgi:hemerythrin-like domain-containing protein
VNVRATEVLGEEHRWIRDMLECLSRVIERAAQDQPLPRETSELLSLFESFADGTHQEKEESFLFPRLLQLATPKDDRLLQKLQQDHGKDRVMMSGMQSNLLGAIHGEPLCLREFVDQATSYLRMHRHHMRRETKELFPLAERVLTMADDHEITEGMATLERAGEQGRERIRQRIDALCERFGVETSSVE